MSREVARREERIAQTEKGVRGETPGDSIGWAAPQVAQALTGQRPAVSPHMEAGPGPVELETQQDLPGEDCHTSRAGCLQGIM